MEAEFWVHRFMPAAQIRRREADSGHGRGKKTGMESGILGFKALGSRAAMAGVVLRAPQLEMERRITRKWRWGKLGFGGQRKRGESLLGFGGARIRVWQRTESKD
jgi:hypothetical protein